MKIPHPVHKLNPYNYTDQHITHATQKANKVARRSKKTRGTNAAGMAKPKPETFHAYINLKVHSYTNGMVLLGHDNIIHIYAR